MVRPSKVEPSLGERIRQLAATRYVITFAVRSGSTLLCIDLTQVARGSPTEHFQGKTVPSPVAARIEAAVAADAPIFGTKVSWEQTFALLRRLSDEGETEAFDLREIFGDDLKVIRLVRRNKVRQAVSAWRAATSGLWHLPPGSMRDGRIPEYDGEGLKALMMQLLAEDWLWERHLADVGLDALTVTYEDYIEDRAGWILEIARHIGRPLQRAPLLVDHIQPMADRWTDELEQRLLDDLSAPVHPFWATPGLRACVPASLPTDACIPLPRPVARRQERSPHSAGRLAGVAGESGEPG